MFIIGILAYCNNVKYDVSIMKFDLFKYNELIILKRSIYLHSTDKIKNSDMEV